MINIIEATEEHLPRIYEIEKEAISPPWTSDALLDEIRKCDSQVFVALDDDDTREPSPCAVPCILGFAIFRQVGDDGELLQIAVDRTMRGNGVGDLLMEALIEFASSSLFPSILLEVRCSNIAAVRLYEKHGFIAMRVRNGYYDNPSEDALIMVKVL